MGAIILYFALMLYAAGGRYTRRAACGFFVYAESYEVDTPPPSGDFALPICGVKRDNFSQHELLHFFVVPIPNRERYALSSPYEPSSFVSAPAADAAGHDFRSSSGTYHHLSGNSDSGEEETLWQERPSMALFASRVLRNVFILAAIAAGLIGIGWLVAAVASEGAHHAGNVVSAAASVGRVNQVLIGIGVFLAVVVCLRTVWYFLWLKSTKYSASSERLTIKTGAVHTAICSYELQKLGVATIRRPLFLRIAGVGNLHFSRLHLVLYGLRNPEFVRDFLRRGGQARA